MRGICQKPELTTEGFLVLSLHLFIGNLPATAIVGMILNIMHMVLNALNPNKDLIDLRKPSPYLACSMYNIDFNTCADSTA